MLNLTPPPPITPPLHCHPRQTQPSTSSQPSTSHAEERKEENEEKASLLTIRESLLQDIETGDEDKDSDDEIVMLTKARLKNLLSTRCSCPDDTFEYSFQPDAYKNTITMHCIRCNFKNTSKPEVVKAGRRRTSRICRKGKGGLGA